MDAIRSTATLGFPSSVPPPGVAPPLISLSDIDTDPTSVTTASPKPRSTSVITSLVTPTAPGERPSPSIVVVTSLVASSSFSTRTSSVTHESSSSSPESTATGEANSTSGRGLRPGAKAGISIGVILGILLIATAIFFLIRWRYRRKLKTESPSLDLDEYKPPTAGKLAYAHYGISRHTTETLIDSTSDQPKEPQERPVGIVRSKSGVSYASTREAELSSLSERSEGIEDAERHHGSARPADEDEELDDGRWIART